MDSKEEGRAPQINSIYILDTQQRDMDFSVYVPYVKY